MLIGNGARLNSNPMRIMAGVGLNNDMAIPLPPAGARRNQTISFGNFASTPRGIQPPYSWILPRKSGDMVSYAEVTGLGAALADLRMGINLTSSVGGVGDVSPILTALAHITAAVYGSGTILPAQFLCPL